MQVVDSTTPVSTCPVPIFARNATGSRSGPPPEFGVGSHCARGAPLPGATATAAASTPITRTALSLRITRAEAIPVAHPRATAHVPTAAVPAGATSGASHRQRIATQRPHEGPRLKPPPPAAAAVTKVE